jgi:predicted helicase
MVDIHLFRRSGAYMFPLYHYNGNNNSSANYLFNEEGKKDNFTEKFRRFIQSKYSEVAAIPDKKQILKEIKFLKSLQKNAESIINNLQKFGKGGINEALCLTETAKMEEIKTQIENKEKQLSAEINSELRFIPTPEQIFGYIYALLHSTPYCEKYDEFLKMDFPRIPFCENPAQFRTLSELGSKLTDLHLQKVNLSDIGFTDLGNFNGDGENIVLKPEYKIDITQAGEERRLYINPTQYFENVPQNVYEHSIGGYFVLEKFLKDRRNKKLDLSEIMNLTQSIRAIAGTFLLIEKIDAQTKSLFL